MNRRNFLTGLASCAATVTAFVSLPSFAAKKPNVSLNGFVLSPGGYTGVSIMEDGQIVGRVLAPQSWIVADDNIIEFVDPQING